MNQILETERLIIRKFDKKDYQDAYEYLSDEDVMKFIESPFSYQQTVEFVNTFMCEKPNVYALVEKVSSKVIGHVIFHSYEYENVYEIGWLINKNYQGKGYAYEISTSFIKYGFNELKLHRIFATTVLANTNSCNLLEKLNMRREALFKKANFHNKEWIDECWYGILNEEYLVNK